MTYLTVYPWTRVNEIWVDSSVNCEPVSQTYRHALIQGRPNQTTFQAEFYKHIAVDIVTESVYNYPYPYITEKTLRPISCKRMFILVAPPGTLALLHNKGFKTFGDVIDERYDQEKNPMQRWHLICQSIKQFVTKPIGQIRQIVLDHQEVLEHNFDTLKDLEKTELEIFNDSL